jgi:hypothetical protein
MRWVYVVMLGSLAACPRGPTGPASPDPSTISDAVPASAEAPPADAPPDAPLDAAPLPDAPLAVVPPDAVDATVALTPEEALFDACANACTMYAVCYEIVYEVDYFKGSNCMSECEDMAVADRTDFFKSAAAIEPLRGKRRKRACEKLIGE